MEKRLFLSRLGVNMIKMASINKKSLYFILVKQNKAAAYVQRGNTDDDVMLELIQDDMKNDVINEIQRNLLVAPDSAYMNDIGSWEYMKEYCFKSANLHGPFLWAYFDPEANAIKCGFDVKIGK